MSVTTSKSATTCSDVTLSGSVTGSWGHSPIFGSPTCNGAGTFTKYIWFKGFGFSIPATSTILDVKMKYRIKGNPETTETIRDHKLFFYNGSILSGGWQISAVYDNLNYTEESRGIGDSGLSASTINGNNFGFILSVEQVAAGTEHHLIDAGIDEWPTITVEYSV